MFKSQHPMQNLKRFSPFIFFLLATACTSTSYNKTVEKVDLPKFMGNWYVLAGRFTFLEVDVHNAVESYTWNEKENRIDIGFTYNRGSLTGDQVSLPQKAWVENKSTNAHWKVSPLWPLKFDYLVIDIAEDYSWTAIGVPNQKYLWIMARSPADADRIVQAALTRLQAKGYDISQIVTVPHSPQSPLAQ